MADARGDGDAALRRHPLFAKIMSYGYQSDAVQRAFLGLLQQRGGIPPEEARDTPTFVNDLLDLLHASLEQELELQGEQRKGRAFAGSDLALPRCVVSSSTTGTEGEGGGRGGQPVGRQRPRH